MEEVKIIRLRLGIYRLTSGAEGVTLSAKDLHQLYDWLLRNMSRLERETLTDSATLAEEWQEHYQQGQE